MQLVQAYSMVVHLHFPEEPNVYGCSGYPFAPEHHDMLEMDRVTLPEVKLHFGEKARLCKHCFPGQPEASEWS